MPRPILKKVEINKIITKSLDLLSWLQNTINLKNFSKSKFINGDEDQLNRVFINLIKIQKSLYRTFSKAPNFKGNIDIEIDDNNDYIIVRISDNGPGITDAKKAMTPYFTTKKTGTGLGLPIVTKIINEHSGSILIENKGKKTGVIVTISLPKYA